MIEELKELAKDNPDILKWIDSNILKIQAEVSILNEKFFTESHKDYIKYQLLNKTQDDLVDHAAEFISNGKDIKVEYYVIKRN